MKKASALLVAFIIAYSLSSCGISDKQESTAETTKPVEDSSTVRVPNPVHETTPAEIMETLGISFHLPDAAADVSYSIIDVKEGSRIAQAAFKIDNVGYYYRISSSAKFDDISGAYYEWTSVKKIEVGYCSGEVRYIEGKQGICLWYDVVPGLLYSLYTDTGASEKTLSSLAGKLFVPAQGDAGSNEALCKENEKALFSFKTEGSGKILSICISETEDYIVYRYGTKEKIELEFPDNKVDSWSKFTYTYYLRGGGKENEGLDLNTLVFENAGFKYEVYQNYTAANDVTSVGVKVTEISTNKETDIKGLNDTILGSLITLRDNGKIKISD